MIAAVTMAETAAELKKLIRLPAYAIPTLAFPAGFYTFFGVVLNGSHGVSSARVATYLLATYGAFGVVGCALFAFGVGVAVERGQGWLLIKRASPMPLAAYFTAKLLTMLTFAALVVMLLSTIGYQFGGVSLPLGPWLALVAALLFGAIPFAAIGLAIGFIAGPNSAPAIVNLVYLPLSFLSGLWIPIENLPPTVAHLAPYLPTYHLGQLALEAVGVGHGSPLAHIGVLALWSAGGIAAAAYGMKRDEGRTYG